MLIVSGRPIAAAAQNPSTKYSLEIDKNRFRQTGRGDELVITESLIRRVSVSGRDA